MVPPISDVPFGVEQYVLGSQSGASRARRSVDAGATASRSPYMTATPPVLQADRWASVSPAGPAAARRIPEASRSEVIANRSSGMTNAATERGRARSASGRQFGPAGPDQTGSLLQRESGVWSRW